MTSTVLYLAQDQIGTRNLTDWLKDNVAVTVIFIIAIVALFAGARSNYAKVIMTASLSVIGLMMLAIAGSASAQMSVGEWAWSLLGVQI